MELVIGPGEQESFKRVKGVEYIRQGVATIGENWLDLARTVDDGTRSEGNCPRQYCERTADECSLAHCGEITLLFNKFKPCATDILFVFAAALPLGVKIMPSVVNFSSLNLHRVLSPYPNPNLCEQFLKEIFRKSNTHGPKRANTITLEGSARARFQDLVGEDRNS